MEIKKILKGNILDTINSLKTTWSSNKIQEEINKKASEIIDEAPAELNTLAKIANAHKENKKNTDSLVTSKADKIHVHTKDQISNLLIIDNLNSDDSLNPLSAKQGKSLKSSINIINGELGKIHKFENQAELDKISSGKVEEWNSKETIAGAQEKATAAETNAKTYADNKVASLVGTSPEALDTIQEISAALNNDPKIVDTLTTQIGSKANKKHTHTKSDITDLFLVENSLTSTSKTNALSAAQGKILKEKIEAHHTHNNKPELDLIKSGDTDKWNKITTKYDDFEIVGEEIIFKIDGTEVKRGTLPHGFSGKYTDLTDVPTEFNPTKHTHTKDDITDLFIVENELTSNSTINAASVSRVKSINDKNDRLNERVGIIEGNMETWSSKADGIHTHNLDDLTEGTINKFVVQEEKDKWNKSVTIVDGDVQETSTWSSRKIQDEFIKNKFKTRRIIVNSWNGPNENGLYYTNITHSLDSSKIIFYAYNKNTGLSELLSHKIIDLNNIEVFSEDKEPIIIELFSGEATTLIETENQIDDTIEVVGKTWSSSKIKQEIINNKPNVEGLDQLKNDVNSLKNKTEINDNAETITNTWSAVKINELTGNMAILVDDKINKVLAKI